MSVTQTMRTGGSAPARLKRGTGFDLSKLLDPEVLRAVEASLFQSGVQQISW